MPSDATYTLALRTMSYLIDGNARDTVMRASRIGADTIDIPVLSHCSCCRKRHVVAVRLEDITEIVEHESAPRASQFVPSWAIA
jgi:hypothetical protein